MKMLSKPITTTRLPRCKDVTVMPMHPMIEKTALIRAEAEPVSPVCSESIRYLLGGEIKLPIIVIGRNVAAKAHGLLRPTVQSRMPEITVMMKLALISEKREKRDENATYRRGPANIVAALKEKR